MDQINVKDKTIPKARSLSVTDYVLEQILVRIHSGEWPTGYAIPSERILVQELGVSRIALREAILKLRTLGVLEVSQGKRSTVARMDSSILARLFPLIMSLDGEKTFRDIFQVRLSVESDTAYLAADNRTAEDLQKLTDIMETMRQVPADNISAWVEQDVVFHTQIARSTGNPLYALILDSFSNFIAGFQLSSDSAAASNREKALFFHNAIVEAIQNRDGDHARVLMQSHLRSGADLILNSGAWDIAKSVPTAM